MKQKQHPVMWEQISDFFFAIFCIFVFVSAIMQWFSWIDPPRTFCPIINPGFNSELIMLQEIQDKLETMKEIN